MTVQTTAAAVSAEDRIAQERDAMETIDKKMNEISSKVSEHHVLLLELSKQQDEIRQEITSVQRRTTELEEERRRITEAETSAVNQSRALRSRVETMQRGIPYRTVEEIEERIKAIEYKRMTGSISLKEDKVLQVEIEKLRKRIPELQELKKLQQELSSQGPGSQGPGSQANSPSPRSSESEAAVDARVTIREQLRLLRETRDSLRSKLELLQTQRQQAYEPVRDLMDERTKLRAERSEHAEVLNQLITDQKQKESAHFAELSRKRQERQELERFNRQISLIEQDKKSLQTALQSLNRDEYDWTTVTALQVREYLDHAIRQYDHGTLAAGEQEEETVATAVPEKVTVGDQNFVVRIKKTDAPAPLPKKTRASRQKQAPPSMYMNHSLASLKDLRSLDLTVPKTIDDAREVVAQIDEIVEAQNNKLSTSRANKDKKQQDLQSKLDALLLKEKQLLEKAPTGWKRPTPPTTTTTTGTGVSQRNGAAVKVI
ncbi:hypothetical protein GNI_121340 [Gregarina niphandrodes]|uniref:Uncharacterized protein n=1 Tax=Gregarina niphandrodes TaxID=110365 RepID=A0A023B2F4_GRENI|nr:hypothetical protein GNI_121340 [Gregarina niphandrodes]EZG53786.1 hypothetical protein GNI_121340 [Gregarina niphandrodes]|eukprot:XP_011131861.1 hypothetical protein GNI_121340 [Gregarina niphandrodes]